MASSTVSSLKKKARVYTLLGRHHIILFDNISPTWLLGLCQSVWPTGIQYMFLFCLFSFFLYFPSAYFCHIVKLLIKKETTRSFPTVFFLLSLPVSVGLITTNYNQQPLSSLLKSKCQKDKPHGFLWVIKPHGPSWAQLALVSKRPASYTSIAVQRAEKSPFSSKVSLGLNGRDVPPSDQGQGADTDSVWQPVSSQPAIPTSASHPWEERSRWGDADKVDKSAGWLDVQWQSDLTAAADSDRVVFIL